MSHSVTEMVTDQGMAVQDLGSWGKASIPAEIKTRCTTILPMVGVLVLDTQDKRQKGATSKSPQ